MLNNEKIRLMTRVTVYEKGMGVKDEKTAKYFRNDYVFAGMVGSFAAGTIAWGVCAMLYCGYNFEEIFFSVYEDTLGTYLSLALKSYGIFMALFLAATYLVYALRTQAYTLRRHLYEEDLDALLAHTEDLIRRFGNRALGDTCARVGADIPRKLARSDRLSGAACSAQEAGIRPVWFSLGAAAALAVRAAGPADGGPADPGEAFDALTGVTEGAYRDDALAFYEILIEDRPFGDRMRDVLARADGILADACGEIM